MWWSNILHVILLRADITIPRLIAPRIKCSFHVIVNDKIKNTWKKMSPVLPWTHMFSICRWPSVHSHTFVVLLQVELGVTTEHCISSSHVSFSLRSMARMKEIKNDMYMNILPISVEKKLNVWIYNCLEIYRLELSKTTSVNEICISCSIYIIFTCLEWCCHANTYCIKIV